jgi:predicted transcriptional regulator
VGSLSTRSVALMSIHPKFAALILTGQKRVEFRKTRFASDVSHVIIYATNPIKRVIGFFTVKGIKEGRPNDLWRRHHRHGGIELESFQAYYGERDNGIAIEVGEVFGLRRPKRLSVLADNLVPPQSFRYLPPATVEMLGPKERKRRRVPF